jgi:uncharacterized membrane protein (UPF0182 family)
MSDSKQYDIVSAAGTAAKSASTYANSVVKKANITQGTLIFAVIVAVYFIVYFAFVIVEGVRDPAEGTKTNKFLAGSSIFTVVVAVVLILLVPLVCVDRSKDAAASSFHIYGASYTTLTVSLYTAGIACLSIIASGTTPNSKIMSRTLTSGGGIGTAAAAMIFIFGVLALVSDE